MRLNKTERDVLRKRVEIVIPQMSELEIFNHTIGSGNLSEFSIVPYRTATDRISF
jgi:hypothetical protein